MRRYKSLPAISRRPPRRRRGGRVTARRFRRVLARLSPIWAIHQRRIHRRTRAIDRGRRAAQLFSVLSSVRADGLVIVFMIHEPARPAADGRPVVSDARRPLAHRRRRRRRRRAHVASSEIQGPGIANLSVLGG